MPSKSVNHNKLIVIVGPTSSGKSSLAVALARKCNGEVVSADSRQVYQDMDIGTGKITHTEMQGVKHWMLNIASPKRTYTVAQYQKTAVKIIQDVWQRGKLPILCGGTGQYVQAVVEGTMLPHVPPNSKLRTRLAKKSTTELFTLLKKLDPSRAKNIDKHNPRRLVRALEIVAALGKVPQKQTIPITANTLTLGLTYTQAKLNKRIHERLQQRLNKCLVAEVKKLHTQGVSWKQLESFGLEYRYVSYYLQNKIPKQQMVQELEQAIIKYSKRQMTWFRKTPDVHWLTKPSDALKLAKSFTK